MPDINKILSKHFSGESSPTEELVAQQFKQDNPTEYELLQTLWTQKANLPITDFDTPKAWVKLSGKPQARVVHMFPILKKIASVAAVLLLMAVGYQLYNSTKVTDPNESIQATTTTRTATQGDRIIHLADGSTVYLNNNASLEYPNQFGSKNREVSLQGEAFFEVAKDQSRPFIIQTNHSEVKVLGTSFNIDTDNKQTAISVATGKVEVNKTHGQAASTILTPNQTAIVNPTDLKSHPTKNKNYLAWKTGEFQFEKTKLAQVVKDLNTYYDDKIVLQNPNADCLFSSTFHQNDIEEVIKILQVSCGLQLTKNNDRYELH